MKLLLTLLSLPLLSCTTTTETRPDGTVIKTWGVDREAFILGTTTATTIIETTSGK